MGGRLRRLLPSAVAVMVCAVLAPAAIAQGGSGESVEGVCPAELECAFGVPFADAEGATLMMDVYSPPAADDAPAVLAVHGGGFRKGERSDMQPEAEQLARDGFVVFAPDYRLAACPIDCVELSGTAGYDDLYGDLAEAMQWVRSHGDDYGADTTRVGAFGTSAGAALALRLSYQGEAGAERADAAVGWSGPYVLDLRLFGLDLDEPDTTEDLASGEGRALTGCDWGTSIECSELWVEQSATAYVDDCGTVACDPPARMVMGGEEGVIDEDATGEIMAGILDDAGIEADLRIYRIGESCLTGVAPVPAGGCGNGPGDCALSHAAFHNCVDPATGLTETESLAAFFGRHLTGRLRRCDGEIARILGTNRVDTIHGTEEDDVILARGGRDVIRGRGGNDVICGKGGVDRIRGGDGNDVMRGGAGSDSIRGGKGRDVRR